MGDRAAIQDTELAEIYSFAIQLAKDAGQMLLDAVDMRAGKTVREGHVEKESSVDLVTQTDEGRFIIAPYDRSLCPARLGYKP